MECDIETFKVMAVGDPGVGMSTLFQNYALELFPFDQLEEQIGVEFLIKIIRKYNENWKFQIWQMSNKKQGRLLLPQYCRGASGTFFIFDITNINTFINVKEWFELMNEHSNFSGSMMLIGNKVDLEHKREVKIEQVKEACRKFGFSRYIECSFLTGYNVEKMFEIMLEEILHKISLY